MNLWMNRIINFLFILSLMPISVYSQYSVRGIVIDDNGSHVNGAQISLYQNGELEALHVLMLMANTPLTRFLKGNISWLQVASDLQVKRIRFWWIGIWPIISYLKREI